MFTKLLMDRIGPLWYAKMDAHRKQLSPGSVRVHFAISRDGKILDLRVLSNTSNGLSARLCLDAIRQAKVPPLPAEVRTQATLNVDFTVTIYAH
jgi:TonB family protein